MHMFSTNLRNTNTGPVFNMTHTLKNPNVHSVALEMNKSLTNKMSL